MTQREALVPIVALAIRPTMRQRARHRTDQIVVSLSNESSYATHRLLGSTTYARESAGTGPAGQGLVAASIEEQIAVFRSGGHRQSLQA